MQIRSHATHRIYTSFTLFQRTESLFDASFLILFGNPNSKINEGNRPKYKYYVRCTKYSTHRAKLSVGPSQPSVNYISFKV